MANPGDTALDLFHRWCEHQYGGHVDAVNTLFAIFGVNSPLGRFADKSQFANTPHQTWLLDVAYNYGTITRDPPWSEMLSPAARRMRNHSLSRDGRFHRRVPMTPAARDALLGYFHETLDLLHEMLDLMREIKPGRGYATRESRTRITRTIEKHIKAVETALQRI